MGLGSQKKNNFDEPLTSRYLREHASDKRSVICSVISLAFVAYDHVIFCNNAIHETCEYSIETVTVIRAGLASVDTRTFKFIIGLNLFAYCNRELPLHLYDPGVAAHAKCLRKFGSTFQSYHAEGKSA